MATQLHIERLTSENGQAKTKVTYKELLDLLKKDGHQILPAAAGFANITKVYDAKRPYPVTYLAHKVDGKTHLDELCMGVSGGTSRTTRFSIICEDTASRINNDKSFFRRRWPPATPFFLIAEQ